MSVDTLDAQMGVFVGKPFQKPTHGSCCTCQHCGDDYDTCGDSCYYSEELEDALAVWQELNKRGWYVSVQTGPIGAPSVVCAEKIVNEIDIERIKICAVTTAMALCLVAQKVMESEQ
jgi:hypothetical protein